MKTTLNDVIEFIANASTSDLSDIADEIQEKGYEFECYECEVHECPEHDSTEDIEYVKHQFLQHLAYRLDQFGLDDMLEELKCESDRLGVNLRVGGGA